MLDTLLPTIDEQDATLNILLDITDTKRGLFDAVGKVLKVLIGTMDSDDAQYYNDFLNDLSEGEKDLTNLIKVQANVVQSTIKNFNHTITSLNNVEDNFNRHLSQIQNLIQTTSKALNTQLIDQKIADQLNLLLIIFTELNREYTNLLGSILFAKKKKHSTSIDI